MSYNRKKTPAAEPAYFPVRGHRTIAELDDLLADCGIEAHESCGIATCATTRRYRRLKESFLQLILREIRADRNGGKVCD